MDRTAYNHSPYHTKSSSRVAKDSQNGKLHPAPPVHVATSRGYSRTSQYEALPNQKPGPPRLSLPSKHVGSAQAVDTEITVLSSRYASAETPRRRASVSYPQHRPRTHDSVHYAAAPRQASPPTTLYQPEPRKVFPNSARPRFLSSPSAASNAEEIVILPPAPEKKPATPQESILVLPPADVIQQQIKPEPTPRSPPSAVAPVYVSPDHIFVMLAGDHTLRISSPESSSKLRRIRDAVVPLWPKGVEYSREHRGECEVSFGGEIWCAGGSDSIAARRLLAKLFSELALEGYFYLCSIQASPPINPSRMLFSSAQPQNTDFFIISFSMNYTKITLIDAPQDVVEGITSALKIPSPLKVKEKQPKAGVNTKQRSLYVLQLRTSRLNLPSRTPFKRFIRARVGPDILPVLSQLLKAIAPYGYRLEASVPMGQSGILGTRGSREVWVVRQVGRL